MYVFTYKSLFTGEMNYVQELKENNVPNDNVRIYYSPFSRTSHTAKVVASVLNIPFEGPQCKVNYPMLIDSL